MVMSHRYNTGILHWARRCGRLGDYRITITSEYGMTLNVTKTSNERTLTQISHEKGGVSWRCLESPWCIRGCTSSFALLGVIWPVGSIGDAGFDDRAVSGMNFELLRLEKWEELWEESDHHCCCCRNEDDLSVCVYACVREREREREREAS